MATVWYSAVFSPNGSKTDFSVLGKIALHFTTPPPNCMNGRIEAKQDFSISGKMALHFTTTDPSVSHYRRKMPKFDTKFLTRASCFLSQRSFLRQTNATSKILNINRNKTWVLFINRLCSLTVMDQKHYNFINHRFHHKT